MADELTVAVVGIDFPNADKTKSNRRMELLLCPPGEPVELVLEPKNPYDSNAISVWSARGVQVGYINAERAPWIGNRIRGGEDCQAVMQGLDGWSGFIRIRFGGDAPSLPPAPAVAPPPRAPRPPRRSGPIDPDAFYPDEEGSEWGA